MSLQLRAYAAAAEPARRPDRGGGGLPLALERFGRNAGHLLAREGAGEAGLGGIIRLDRRFEFGQRRAQRAEFAVEQDGEVAAGAGEQRLREGRQPLQLGQVGIVAEGQANGAEEQIERPAQIARRIAERRRGGEEGVLPGRGPCGGVDQPERRPVLDGAVDEADLGGELLEAGERRGVMRIEGRPGESGRMGVPVPQREAERLIGRQAVGPRPVQRLDIGVELVAPQPEPLIDHDPAGGVGPAAAFPGLAQLAEETPAVGLAGMELEAMVAEAVLAQAAMDDVERRRLLGDEQHRLARGEAVGDHVGDGLALAGAGRADDDEIAALRRRRGWRRSARNRPAAARRCPAARSGGRARARPRTACRRGSNASSGVSMRCRTTRFWRSASVRSTRSFHIRYLAKEKVDSAVSSTTSMPGTSRTAWRIWPSRRGTSTPLSSRGRSPVNCGKARSKSRSRNCSSVALKRGSSSWKRSEKREEALRRSSFTGTSKSGAR